MSIGPGAALGGGLQVCPQGQFCILSNPSDPLSPGDNCNNGGPGNPNDPGGPGNGGTCSAPSGGGGSMSGGSGISGGGDGVSYPTWSGGSGSNGSGTWGIVYYPLGGGFAYPLPYAPDGQYGIAYPLSDPGTSTIGCPPPPGTAPDPVPGSEDGNPFDLVYVNDTTFGGSRVSGLSITCLETGGSQTGTCSPSTFYYTPDVFIRHYLTPGGSGTDCDPPNQGQSFLFSGGSNVSSSDPEVKIDVS